MNWFRLAGMLSALWGAGILISSLFRESSGSGAYAVGQYTGMAFGVLLLGAGLYAAITGGRKKR